MDVLLILLIVAGMISAFIVAAAISFLLAFSRWLGGWKVELALGAFVSAGSIWFCLWVRAEVLGMFENGADGPGGFVLAMIYWAFWPTAFLALALTVGARVDGWKRGNRDVSRRSAAS